MAWPSYCGFKVFSTNRAVGDAGKPILFYGAFATSSSGGSSTVIVHNGQATTDPVVFNLTSTAGASKAVNVVLPIPVMLPKGCFVETDANTQLVSVQYVQLATS